MTKKIKLKKIGGLGNTQLIGWKCPTCGRGNSPWTATCSCVNTPPPPPHYWPYVTTHPYPYIDSNLPYYGPFCGSGGAGGHTNKGLTSH